MFSNLKDIGLDKKEVLAAVAKGDLNIVKKILSDDIEIEYELFIEMIQQAALHDQELALKLLMTSRYESGKAASCLEYLSEHPLRNGESNMKLAQVVMKVSNEIQQSHEARKTFLLGLIDKKDKSTLSQFFAKQSLFEKKLVNVLLEYSDLTPHTAKKLKDNEDRRPIQKKGKQSI